MPEFQRVDHYLETHLGESIAELSRLCSQPSVSALNWGIKECAQLVGELLQKRGFDVRIEPTAGAPVILAERIGRGKKTLLFYNHYDVQPAEPLEQWHNPPFVPTLKDGVLYGRGVNDDKGHITSRLFAIDALLASEGELPCTIKFVIEGEEEISSVNLHSFVSGHREALKADACIWEFGGVDHRNFPIQYLGLRGICYVELSVETATQDIHSGIGGSIFPNAAWRLVWALNSLKGPDERVRIPGFYDAVRSPSKRDIELMDALPNTGMQFKQQYGIANFIKGLEDDVYLRLAEVFEPTCTVCGLTAGYQGPGLKTILPSTASAKLDFRLVPDQKPEKVFEQLRVHLDAEGFSDIHIKYWGGEVPARTDPDDPFVRLVVESAEGVYGKPMQIVPMLGGSGPYNIIKQALGIPIVTAGVSHPGAQTHAPNENLRLDLYLLGAKHIARILKQFGSAK